MTMTESADSGLYLEVVRILTGPRAFTGNARPGERSSPNHAPLCLEGPFKSTLANKSSSSTRL